MRRVHLIAEGQVQGVWFRASVRDRAQQLGLSGWARNLPDGRVEVQAQGDAAALDALADYCRQGPGHAVVAHLEVADIPPLGTETGFEIR